MENVYSELRGGTKDKHKGCKDPQKECVPNQEAFESTGRRSCSPKKLSELKMKDIAFGRELCKCDQKTTRCKKTSLFTEDFSFGAKKTISQKSSEKAKKKLSRVKASKKSMDIKKTSSKVKSNKCLDSDYLCGKPAGKFKCQFLVKANLDKKGRIQARKDCICNPDTHKCLSTTSLKGQNIMNQKIDKKATVLKLDIEKKYRIYMQKSLRRDTLTQDIKQSIRLEVANQIADYTADIEAKKLATLSVFHRKPAPASSSRLLKIKKKTNKLVKKGDNPKKMEVSLQINKYLSGICRKIIQIFNKLLQIYGIKIIGFNTSNDSGSNIIARFLSILKTFYQGLLSEQNYLKPVLKFVFEQGSIIQDSLRNIDEKKRSYLCYAAFVRLSLNDTKSKSVKTHLEQDFSDSERNFVAISYSLERLTAALEDIYQFAGQDLENLNDAILDFKFTNYGNIMMLRTSQPSQKLEKSKHTKTSIQKLKTKLKKTLKKGFQKVETGDSRGKRLTENLGLKVKTFLIDSARESEKGAEDIEEIIQDVVSNVSTDVGKAIDVVKSDSEKVVKKGALTLGKISSKTESIVTKLVDRVMEHVSDGIKTIHLTESKTEPHVDESRLTEEVQDNIVENVKDGVEKGIEALKSGTGTVAEISENIGTTVTNDIREGLHVSVKEARVAGSKIADITKEVLSEIKISGVEAVSLVEKVSLGTKNIISNIVDELGRGEKKMTKLGNVQVNKTASEEEQRRSIFESLVKKINDIQTLKLNVLLCKEGNFQLQIQQEYLTNIADFLRSSSEPQLKNLFLREGTNYLENLGSDYSEDGEKLGEPPRAVILEHLLDHINNTVIPKINKLKEAGESSDVIGYLEQFVNFLLNDGDEAFSLKAGVSAIDSYFTPENYKTFVDTINKFEVIKKLKEEEEGGNISIHKIKAQYEMLEEISTQIDTIQEEYITVVFSQKSKFDKALLQYNQTEPVPHPRPTSETTSSDNETEEEEEEDDDEE